MHLFDASGQRKYLTPQQRQSLLDTAENAKPKVFTFCGTLVHSGCRISEVLALTGNRIDLPAGVVIVESLKKRRKGVFRSVPVPSSLLSKLDAVHNLSELAEGRLWKWSRTTAWRRVKELMDAAGIHGLYATPKGVRHGFGVKAVVENVPLNMAQKWMGHARIETTAIYADAVGPEERKLAERMWT
jgi:integrase/recombinase XerD